MYGIEKGEERSVWCARRARGITEGKKGEGTGRKGVAARGGGREGRYFRKLRRSAARAREHKKTRNALSRTTNDRGGPTTITVVRSIEFGSSRSGPEAKTRERSGIARRNRHAPRIRSGVGLPTSRHSPVPWTVLYLPLSMILFIPGHSARYLSVGTRSFISCLDVRR